MPRLFFALWPDDRARAALAPHARRVAEEGGGRAVPAANLHLTLVFLGDVAAGRVDALHRMGATVRAQSFELVLDRLGSFRRAGVAWAGPSLVPPTLAGLQASLEEALRRAGFETEARPFAPHLTLARKLARGIEAAPIDPVGWTVSRFALVESAREKGAYAEVAGWSLEKGN